FLALPELQVRGSLLGRVLAPRATLSRQDEGGAGIRAKGVIVFDEMDGVTIGIDGSYSIPPLLEIHVPFGARFPKYRKDDPTAAADDWYIYLGADGYESQGRAIGPVRATVLPDIMRAEADAYLMFRGKGIDKFPRGGD